MRNDKGHHEYQTLLTQDVALSHISCATLSRARTGIVATGLPQVGGLARPIGKGGLVTSRRTRPRRHAQCRLGRTWRRRSAAGDFRSTRKTRWRSAKPNNRKQRPQAAIGRFGRQCHRLSKVVSGDPVSLHTPYQRTSHACDRRSIVWYCFARQDSQGSL